MTMTESVVIDTDRLAQLRQRVAEVRCEQLGLESAFADLRARESVLRVERSDLEGEYARVSGYHDVLKGEI